MNAFKLPENQVIDFIADALLMRWVSPGRIPLHDEEELFVFAVRFTDLAALWHACPRSDWMLWLLEKARNSGLIPQAAAEQILNRFVLAREDAKWLAQQARRMKESLANPFDSIDETPLLERRKEVGYWVLEGDGPVVSRICARFKTDISSSSRARLSAPRHRAASLGRSRDLK